MTIEDLIYAALATCYCVFLFTAKRGPFDIFSKARAWIRAKLPLVLAEHLTCPTCLALSLGAAFFLLALSPLNFVVKIIAVAGAVLVLHGMAGYWHSRDDE